MKANGKLVIETNLKSIPTSNPRLDNTPGTLHTIAKGIDDSIWIKTGTNNGEWEQLFTTTSGEFVANIELADATGIVVADNTIGALDGKIVIGDGKTTGGIKLASRIDALYERPDGMALIVFADIISLAEIVLSVGTDSGYATIRWWDGSIDTFAVSAFGTSFTKPKFAGEWDTYVDKRVLIWSSDVDGVPSGEIRIINASGQGGASHINISGLTGLSGPVPASNFSNLSLNSIFLRDIGTIGALQLTGNDIITIDLEGTTLSTIILNDNLGLTEFSGLLYAGNHNLSNTKISEITFDLPNTVELTMDNARLKTIDLTGMSMQTMTVSNNRLVSVNLTNASTGFADLNFNDNLITEVIADGFEGNQPFGAGAFKINLNNNLMTTDAVYDMVVNMAAESSGVAEYDISLLGNPCDDGAGGFVEDGVHTQAEIAALGDSLDYNFKLTGGDV